MKINANKLLPNKLLKKPLEPLETLEWLIYVLNLCAKPIVGDYFGKGWTVKYNFRVLQVFSLSIFTAFCYIWAGYVHRNNIEEFVFSVCLIMIDVVSLQRIIKWMSKHGEMMEIKNHLLIFATRWEHVPEALGVLVWYFRLLHQLVFALLIIICGSLTCLSLAPILYYGFFGKMLIFVPCYIPGIDYQVHPGFEIHVVFHAWCCFCIGTGIGATSAFVLMMLAQNCIEVDVLRARLMILTALIHTKDKYDQNLDNVLKGIFEQHQVLNQFLDYCEDILSVQNMCDHIVVGVLTCLSLFICLQEFWLTGYFALVCSFSIVFVLDLLGTIIEVKLESLCQAVYDVPWYLMSVKNQRMYCYFLSNAQKTSRLTLAGHFPQNLNTFVRFYKGIYSYLMVLKEVQL